MPDEEQLAVMKKQITQFMEQGIPFNKYLGLKVGALRSGYAELHLDLRDELVGDPLRPALHGGVISALADTCGGACLWSDLQVGDALSTVDLRVDYLRRCPTQGTLVAAGTTRRLGNRVGVANIVLYMQDTPDIHIAEAKGVYNVVRRDVKEEKAGA